MTLIVLGLKDLWFILWTIFPTVGAQNRHMSAKSPISVLLRLSECYGTQGHFFPIIPFTTLHPLPPAPNCSSPSAIPGQPQLLLPGTDTFGPNILENSYSAEMFKAVAKSKNANCYLLTMWPWTSLCLSSLSVKWEISLYLLQTCVVGIGLRAVPAHRKLHRTVAITTIQRIPWLWIGKGKGSFLCTPTISVLTWINAITYVAFQ